VIKELWFLQRNIEIIDTKRKQPDFAFCKTIANVNAGFVAKVNTDLRALSSKNHSTTH
jgi:alanyl-tRNA synthetase